MVQHNQNHAWHQEKPIPRVKTVDPVPATPDEQALLERIAQVRAEGAGWDQTADRLKRPAAELEELARAHPILFRRLMNRADREVAREDRRVARVVFRRQIRSDPESQAARLSAQQLVNIDLTYFRHRNKKPRIIGLDPNDPGIQQALSDYELLNSLTREEWDEMRAKSIDDRIRKRLAEMGLDPAAYFGEGQSPNDPDDLDDHGNPVPRDPTPPADSDSGAAAPSGACETNGTDESPQSHQSHGSYQSHQSYDDPQPSSQAHPATHEPSHAPLASRSCPRVRLSCRALARLRRR
jgi:hypothetical protein